MVDGAGHYPHSEYPAVVAGEVLRLVAAVGLHAARLEQTAAAGTAATYTADAAGEGPGEPAHGAGVGSSGPSGTH